MGVRTCQLGVWTCQLRVWTCQLGVWACRLGVWICILGVWTCQLLSGFVSWFTWEIDVSSPGKNEAVIKSAASAASPARFQAVVKPAWTPFQGGRASSRLDHGSPKVDQNSLKFTKSMLYKITLLGFDIAGFWGSRDRVGCQRSLNP